MWSPGSRRVSIACVSKRGGNVGLSPLTSRMQSCPAEQKRARRADQHVAEIVAGLQQQSEPRRKQLPHDVLGACRRIDAVAAPAEHLGHRFDGRGDVAQEAGG